MASATAQRREKQAGNPARPPSRDHDPACSWGCPMLWGAKEGKALLCLPQCIPRKICSQKKRPPGDLTRKPPQCPQPQRHTQDETAGTARCSGPTPPAVSLHPIRAPKTTCMTYGTKRSTTFGRGPAQSRESGLGVDQRPLACLSPSFSPHSPPSSSHSPFSCHGQKNSFSNLTLFESQLETG